MACYPTFHAYSAILISSFHAYSGIEDSFVKFVFMLKNITFRSISID